MTKPSAPPMSMSPAPSMTIAEAAALWDVTPGFLNSCSYGPPPKPAWDALQQSLDEWRAGAGPWAPWAETVGTSRNLFAQMVGIDARHVTTGVAVSQLLAPIGAAVPDNATVLVPDIEFTSGVFPFAVHTDRGVTVRPVPLNSLADAIDKNTAVVSFSAVQSATGEVADIAAIVERARAVGAVTVIDVTQAAGWLPLNAMDVDMLTGSAYKWLCAPRGTAFATMHPEMADRHPEFASRLKPLAAGWYAGQEGAYYGMPLRLRDDARAFDISPAWHSWVGTAPSLEVLSAVGIPAIYEHNVALANAFRTGIDMAPSNSAIVSAPLSADAIERMRAAGLRFSVMDGRARLAFHLYNTDADTAAALTAVHS